MAVWSVVKRSEIERTSRMDPEYYQPEYLEVENILKQVNATPISDLALCKHRKFKPRFNEPFKYIEISEVNTSTGESNPIEIIGQNAPSRAQRIIRKDDIIVSTVRPNRNAVSLIHKDEDGFVCSTGFAVLEPKNILSEYLFVCLKTKYSIKQLERSTTASMYPAVNERDILESLLFVVDNKCQQMTKGLILKVSLYLKESKYLYFQAEQMLLEELGLKDLDLKDDLFYTTTLKDVNESNRMDAEYFMAKYEVAEKELDKFKHLKLDQICSHINYGTVPTSPYVEEGTPYIKGLNLVDCFIDVTKLDKLDRDTTRKLSQKFYVKENDIVISQMGTVGKAGIVQKEQEGWLFASFTIRVRLKKDSGMNPHYLTLFIEKVSRPYYLLRKIAHASVRQNTDLPTIKGLKVPLLDDKTQTQISRLLTASYEQKKEAKFLLDQAIRKVEGMIEKEAGRT